MNYPQPRSLRQPAQKHSLSTALRRLAALPAASVLVVSALLAMGARVASAQTYTYSGTTPGTTLAPTSGTTFTAAFDGPTYDTPTSSATTALVFGGSTTYTATNDLGAFTLNKMTFTATGETVAAAAGSSFVFAGTTPTISVSSGLSDTLSAPITSTVGFTLSGGGTLIDTSTATNSLGTGTITVNNSTLQFGGTASFTNTLLAVSGVSTLIAQVAPTINASAATTTLSGSGTLHLANTTATGTNQFTIALNMSSFSGTVVLDGNTQLRLNNTSNFNTGSTTTLFDLGTGAGRFSNRNGLGATYDLGGLQSTSATTELRGAQTGSSTASGSTSIYSIGALGTNTTFAGLIRDGSETGNLTPPPTTSIIKVGTGALTLTNGSNNYSGTTTVTNGNLVLANTPAANSSATGAGTVAVSGGATAVLSGTGNTAGIVTVTSGSVLAPGVNTNAAGTLGSAGTLALGSGGTVNISLVAATPNNVTVTGGLNLTSAVLDFDLSSTAGGTNDLLTTAGALNLGTLSFTFNELTPGTLDTSAAYTLISGASGVSGFNTNNITTAFIGGNYTPTYSLSGGNNLQVTFAATAAPEPSQFVAFGLGMLGLGGLTLRARRRTGISAAI